jgi:hypothetical protein
MSGLHEEIADDSSGEPARGGVFRDATVSETTAI